MQFQWVLKLYNAHVLQEDEMFTINEYMGEYFQDQESAIKFNGVIIFEEYEVRS